MARIMRQTPAESDAIWGRRGNMTITVEQMLSQAQNHAMKCIAGLGGLANEISGFSVVDTPEILSWLRGGELVVDTGYVAANFPSIKRTLVKDLSQKGCAALGIKAKRYYKTIPEEYIAQGNMYNLPIIELPFEARFCDISLFIHQSLFNNEMAIEEKLHFLYQKVVNDILSDASAERVLYDLSLVVSRPLFLLDYGFNLIAYEYPASNAIELSDFISLQHNKPIFDDEILQSLSQYYKTVCFKTHSITVKSTKAPDESVNFVLTPIGTKDPPMGFLAVAETSYPLATELFKLVANLGPLLELYYIRNHPSGASVKSSGNIFVDNVLLEECKSKETLRYYCDIYGFDYTKQWVCMHLQVSHYSDLPFDKRSIIREAVFSSIKNILDSRSLRYLAVSFNDSFIFFLFFQDGVSQEEAQVKAADISKQLSAVLNDNRVECFIGVSSCYQDIMQIHQAFRQTGDIIFIGKQVHPQESIHTYRQLHIYHMLRSSMNEQELMRLYEETVFRLDEFDRQNNCNYLLTLEAYFNNRFNVSRASTELHVHRNTMLYQLDRIRDILSVNFDDHENVLKLQLGMHARRMLNW
jgi:DNA-binding PucR family transcriptional regulator